MASIINFLTDDSFTQHLFAPIIEMSNRISASNYTGSGPLSATIKVTAYVVAFLLSLVEAIIRGSAALLTAIVYPIPYIGEVPAYFGRSAIVNIIVSRALVFGDQND